MPLLIFILGLLLRWGLMFVAALIITLLVLIVMANPSFWPIVWLVFIVVLVLGRNK